MIKVLLSGCLGKMGQVITRLSHNYDDLKIVAGIGNGIVYSRLFSDLNETERKVIETIRFLTREGLKDDIKIVSFVDDLYIENVNIINPLLTKSDIETTLVELIANDKKIKPQFSKDNYIKKFFCDYHNEILTFLAVCSFICRNRSPYIPARPPRCP